MRNRRASVVFIQITLFIDMLVMGLVIPSLPTLVQSLLDGESLRRRSSSAYSSRSTR